MFELYKSSLQPAHPATTPIQIQNGRSVESARATLSGAAVQPNATAAACATSVNRQKRFVGQAQASNSDSDCWTRSASSLDKPQQRTNHKNKKQAGRRKMIKNCLTNSSSTSARDQHRPEIELVMRILV